MVLPADGANVAEGKESWKGRPREKCHTGTDARWTRKGCASFLVRKLRGKVDKRSKLVKGCVAMAAPAQGTQTAKGLLDGSDQGLEPYAHRANVGQGDTLGQCNIAGQTCEKGRRGLPLPSGQKEPYRAKSKPRGRVEHVQDFMEGAMH